jgi:hypothetical protein
MSRHLWPQSPGDARLALVRLGSYMVRPSCFVECHGPAMVPQDRSLAGDADDA